jgi:hypothetical protein
MIGLALVAFAVVLAVILPILDRPALYHVPSGFHSAAPSGLPSIGDGSLRDRDCSSFRNWRDAQAFYERYGRGDPHNLDQDGDGIACEFLRWW